MFRRGFIGRLFALGVVFGIHRETISQPERAWIGVEQWERHSDEPFLAGWRIVDRDMSRFGYILERTIV